GQAHRRGRRRCRRRARRRWRERRAGGGRVGVGGLRGLHHRARRIAMKAVAHPNIALAKYWGKRAHGHNLPAVPSLSVTLAGMTTRTEVVVEPGRERDALRLDGEPAEGRPVARVSQLFDLLWSEAKRSGPRPRAAVSSENDFPTAAGLASSASAFAALAVAGNAALGTGLPVEILSCIA